MKRKALLLLAMFAIVFTASIVWAWSYQIAHVLHVDHAVVDILSVFVLAFAFIPASLLTEKKEEGLV